MSAVTDPPALVTVPAMVREPTPSRLAIRFSAPDDNTEQLTWTPALPDVTGVGVIGLAFAVPNARTSVAAPCAHRLLRAMSSEGWNFASTKASGVSAGVLEQAASATHAG